MGKSKLTEQQKRFCDEYLATPELNGTKAYMIAYPNVKKESTAAVCVAKLLRIAKIQAYIKGRQKDLHRRTEVTQERIIQEYAAIGFAKITDFLKVDDIEVPVGMSDKGEIQTIKRRGVEIFTTGKMKAAAIESIKQGKKGIEVKLN